MRSMILGLAAAVCLVIPLSAQQTDPQPTCKMCPGTYIPVDELQAYTKKAIAEKRTDQQVRDVDIGKAHIGIGMVYRGKLDAPAPESVAEHDLVSEVYHIIDGSGTLVLGPDIADMKRRPATQETVRLFNGPGNNGTTIRNGKTYNLQGRRRGHHSGRHRALVHQDRRSHHLPDGAHRSRQSDADHGRRSVEEMACHTAPIDDLPEDSGKETQGRDREERKYEDQTSIVTGRCAGRHRGLLGPGACAAQRPKHGRHRRRRHRRRGHRAGRARKPACG